ncbi:hypothetical protein [Embleya sp. NPDC001921]
MNPVPATGPEAAGRLHFTDPRITALAEAAQAAFEDDDRPWDVLDWHQKHVWRTAARDWLRAAVTVGLLPLVDPSTGTALATVTLHVCPGDGRPRVQPRTSRRGTCTACGQEWALTKAGVVRLHHIEPDDRLCDGSRKPPAEDTPSDDESDDHTMTVRHFTPEQLASYGLPPDSPDNVATSETILHDGPLTILKYSERREVVFRADDDRTYAVEYEAAIDAGDHEVGGAPEDHGWSGDLVAAVEVEERPVVVYQWLPVEPEVDPRSSAFDRLTKVYEECGLIEHAARQHAAELLDRHAVEMRG